MINHNKYQRSRSLKAKVIDNSEHMIEKLDRLLLQIILPLLFFAVVNSFIQVLLWFFSYFQTEINPKGN